MLSLPELILKIKVDNSDVKKKFKETEKDANGLSSKVGAKFQSLGKGIAKSLGKVAVAGAVALSAAVVKVGKDAIKAYASFEQLKGGVEKLFGDSADTVMKYAQNAYKTAGISANQYMEQVTSFSASLIQSVGGDTEKAAKTADMAIQDMADNANTFGTSIDSIQNAYQGFAKQNYSMLDNLKLGYGGTKTEMERLLADAEKLSGQKYDISNLNDVYEAIHVVQQEMSITGTTAREAAKTIEGSFNATKAAWENLMIAIATGDEETISQAMTNLTESVGNLAANLGPVIKAVFDGIIIAVKDMLSQVDGAALQAKLGEILTNIGTWISEKIPEGFHTFVSNFTSMVESGFSESGEITSPIMTGIKNLLKGILEAIIKALPDLLLLAADLVVLVGELFETIMQAIFEALANLFLQIWAAVEPYLSELWTSIKEGVVGFFTGIWNWITTTLSNFWNGIKNTLTAILNTVKTVFTKIKTAITDRITQAKDKVKSVFDTIKSAVSDKITALYDKVKSIFNKVKSAIIDPITNAKDKVKGIVDKIKGFFTGLNIKLPKIPLPHFSVSPSGWKIGDLLKGSIPKLGIDWYAKGGFFNGPTILSGLGEAGPEYALPLSRPTLAPLAQMLNELQRQDASSSNEQVIVVNTTLEVDGRAIAKTTAPYMKKAIDKIDIADARQLGLV